jgi:hypothetical protein
MKTVDEVKKVLIFLSPTHKHQNRKRALAIISYQLKKQWGETKKVAMKSYPIFFCVQKDDQKNFNRVWKRLLPRFSVINDDSFISTLYFFFG